MHVLIHTGVKITMSTYFLIRESLACFFLVLLLLLDTNIKCFKRPVYSKNLIS